MVAVWDTDISATFLIFRLKWSTDAAFFKVLGKLFHKGTRRKRSFVSNKWCLVWAGSAFPQSFLSYKQSEAERKDIPEDIPKIFRSKVIHGFIHHSDFLFLSSKI